MTSLKLEKKKETLVVYTSGFGINKSVWNVGKVTKDLQTFVIKPIASTVQRQSVVLLFQDKKEGQFVLPFYNTQVQEVSKSVIGAQLIRQKVRVLVDRKEISGTLITIEPEGSLVLKDDKGGFVIIERYQAITSINEINTNLEKAQIEGEVDGIEDFKQPILNVSYSLTEVSWRAFYQLLLDEDNTTLFFSGKAIVSNYSGTDFKEIDLTLITGEPEVRRYYGAASAPRAQMEMKMATSSARPVNTVASSSGQYYSLQIPGEVTLLDKTENEVKLFDETNLKVRPYFEYQVDDYDILAKKRQVNFGFEFKAPRPLSEGSIEVYSASKQGGPLGIWQGKSIIPTCEEKRKIRLLLGKSMYVSGSHEITSLKVKGEEKKESRVITIKTSFIYTPLESEEEKKNPVIRFLYPKNGRVITGSFETSSDVKVEDKSKFEVGKLRYDIGPLEPGKEVSVTFNFEVKIKVKKLEVPVGIRKIAT